jgi:hypothetical protein
MSFKWISGRFIMISKKIMLFFQAVQVHEGGCDENVDAVSHCGVLVVSREGACEGFCVGESDDGEGSCECGYVYGEVVEFGAFFGKYGEDGGDDENDKGVDDILVEAADVDV